MGIGDGSITHDLKPFIDFFLGTFVTLIIIFFMPRLVAKKKKLNVRDVESIYILACKYISAGIVSVLLLRGLSIFFMLIYGLITWVPIYMIANLLPSSTPDSYLPTVIADVSSIIFSVLFGIITIFIKPERIYKNYAFLAFILGMFVGLAFLYFKILILLLIILGIIGSFVITLITQPTNFQNCDLTYANFTSANLEATDFAGAKLINTDFTDAKF